MSRRWTVRMRLTLLYGALFLGCGAALLGITYLLVDRTATYAFYSTSQSSGASTGVIIGGGRLPTIAPPPFSDLVPELRASAAKTRANTLDHLLTDSGVALAIMAVVSMGLGWLVAGRALRPLRDMTAAAQHISEHNLHERLPVEPPVDELNDLATTVNALLGRLETAFESQRRFVANASHELRTPLTLQRAVIEVALADPDLDVARLRRCCQRVLEIGGDQETLIDALLILARSQRGLDAVTPIDLPALVTDAIDSLTTSGVALETHLEPSTVLGDPRLAERVVTNLVDNAVRYNVDDGWVRVTTSPDGVLAVENSGPVIPADRVASLTEPFQRIGADRTGRGLGVGLSIVASIASAHHAPLQIRPRAEGGLRVSVAFRRATYGLSHG